MRNRVALTSGFRIVDALARASEDNPRICSRETLACSVRCSQFAHRGTATATDTVTAAPTRSSPAQATTPQNAAHASSSQPRLMHANDSDRQQFGG